MWRSDQWLVTIECNSVLLATSHLTVFSGEWLVVGGEWLARDVMDSLTGHGPLAISRSGDHNPHGQPGR